MYIARPVRHADIDDFLKLAQQTGAGFTSLAVSEEEIVRRIHASIEAFQRDICQPVTENYILVLQDMKTGRIIGMSAVKTGVGLKKPFFNFRIFKRTQYSSIAQKNFQIDVMVLVNDFSNSSEVSMLFVHPDFRGGGTGHLISQARYMMMAAHLERFNDMIISELRGVVDREGNSPFWQALGERFFGMSFLEADLLNARTDNQFIIDLMPRFPIYLNLLPKEVHKVIGQTHPEGIGAKKLLEKEGFVYDQVVDIFDGGPLVSCKKSSIRTIRESFQCFLKAGNLKDFHSRKKGLISTDHFKDLRILYAEFCLEDNIAWVEPEVYALLGMEEKDKIRIWVKE